MDAVIVPDVRAKASGLPGASRDQSPFPLALLVLGTFAAGAPDLAPLTAGEIALWIMVATLAGVSVAVALLAAIGRRLDALVHAVDELAHREGHGCPEERPGRPAAPSPASQAIDAGTAPPRLSTAEPSSRRLRPARQPAGRGEPREEDVDELGKTYLLPAAHCQRGPDCDPSRGWCVCSCLDCRPAAPGGAS
jgi:hypothetical protein